jgi:hypothetical protein
MKILRKGDEFMKMHDFNKEDLIKINSMLEKGWEYSPKKAYKDSVGIAKQTATEAKAEAKKEQKIKDKSEKKESKGKKEYKEKKDSKRDKKDRGKGKKK